jgi:hypothetical protein
MMPPGREAAGALPADARGGQTSLLISDVQTELSAAVELYRSMAMTFWMPQVEAALAEVEGR